MPEIIRQAKLKLLSDNSILTSQPDQTLPAINPGQPLSLRWQYWSLNGATLREVVSATILPEMDSTTVYSSPAINYVDGGISEQVDGLVPTVKSIYRLGHPRTLVLRVVAPNVFGSVIMTIARYAVVAEEFRKGLTWDVRGTVTETRQITFAWKEPYPIAARFTNISSWVTLDGTATLYEAEQDEGPWKPIGTTPINTVGPQGMRGLAFPSITHDWTWLTGFVWVVSGDLSKLFFYKIECGLTDEYGNSYNLTSRIAVVVAVSSRKIAFAITALTLNVIALVLYALSWLITTAPGNLAKTAADGFGKAALDPPTPSKAFAQTVSLPSPKPRRFKNPQLDPLAEALSQLECFAQIDLALYEIESRVLGALDAGNKRAARAQRSAYTKAARLLVKTASKAALAIDQTVEALNDWSEIDPAAVRDQLMRWQRSGLRQGRLKRGFRLNLSAATMRRLEACVRSPQIMERALEGLESNLVNLRSTLFQAAQDVFADRHRVVGESTRKKRDSK